MYLIRKLVELIIRLSDGGWHTYSSLSRELGLCVRTIQRNVRALEAAGVLIEFSIDEGHRSGRRHTLRISSNWISRRHWKRTGD